MRATVEKLAELRPDLEPCLVLHWKELALNQAEVPLDVDWDAYHRLEEAGVLFMMALRDEQQRLAGYYIGFISHHLHYRGTKMLNTDIFWTHPFYRGGTAGLRLFRAVEREAKARGVQKIITMSKLHRDSTRLFEAMGYRHIENIFSKWVGE